MLIFFYGPDGYRLKKTLQDTKESYLKKYPTGVNIFNFDFSDKNTKVENLEDTVKSVSFFNEVKLVVIRNAFSSKEVAEAVGSVIKTYQLAKLKEVVLLIAENAERVSITKKNKKLFEDLKKEAQPVVEFNYLSDAKLEGWVKNEFTLRKAVIDSMALRLLIEIVGNESWSLINEINKLANYKSKINKEDILSLVSGKEEDKTFKLTDAFIRRDLKRTFPILYEELERGKDPHSVLALLAYQIRNLIMVKDLLARNSPPAQVAKLVGLHPFVATKLTGAARFFTLEDLKKLHQEISNIDIATKEGRVDIEDSLYNFVFS